MNGKTETARMAYREVREEVLQRIAHRDRIIIAFLAAVGALFAAVLAASNPPLKALYVICPLSLGAAMIAHQHSISIALLVAYVRVDLTPALQNEGAYVPLWEDSTPLHGGDSSNVCLRTVGESAVIAIPFIAALAANWKDAYTNYGLMTIVWWGNVALLLLVVASFHQMHLRRGELLKLRA